jgi:hypothetical protein
MALTVSILKSTMNLYDEFKKYYLTMDGGTQCKAREIERSKILSGAGFAGRFRFRRAQSGAKRCTGPSVFAWKKILATGSAAPSR